MRQSNPSLLLSLLPIVCLIGAITAVIVLEDAGAVQEYSYIIMLGASAVAAALSFFFCRADHRAMASGLVKSARQVLPVVPILLFIGTLGTTWMLSGVVPTLIDYGLQLLNPRLFLLTACAVCAVVSVVTGTSWTTVATIGVAFMGIGLVMGYSAPWIAGAVISGAYFGDKVSPLSDTTVLAAGTSGVDLFTHIRFLMITTVPAMTIALVVYGVVGLFTPVTSASDTASIVEALDSTFNITPWTLVIPALTIVLIAFRLRTDIVLAVSSLAGLAGMFLLQPQVVETLADGSGLGSYLRLSFGVLAEGNGSLTQNELIDSLVSTGGAKGMLPTVYLVLSALVFGGVMVGSGMLSSITSAITKRLSGARNLVAATVGSGLFLNATTGDQYMSIIIGSNIFRSSYAKAGLKPQLLGRTLEDSVSVTSVLIPWNSCGLTQSTVLGVATLIYLPFCIFNILSPVMSLIVAWKGWRVSVSPSSSKQRAAGISPSR